MNQLRMFRLGMGVLLAALLTVTPAVWAADVEIPDQNLDKVIREILKRKQIFALAAHRLRTENGTM